MCESCNELEKLAALAELEQLGPLIELERVAMLAGGFTIPDAVRDLLPHEKQAKVKFRDIFDLMADRADALARAVETLGVIAQRELLGGLTDDVMGSVARLRAKQPEAMVEAERQATDVIEQILIETHERSGENVLAEAKRQGRNVSRETVAAPEAGEFRAMARALAMAPWSMLLADFQTRVFSPSAEVSELAATRKKKRKSVPKAPISKVVPRPKAKVPKHLRDAADAALARIMSSLTDAMKQDVHIAHGRGRNRTAEKLIPGSVFASELLDKATCAKCRAVDGKEYETMAEARADYPEGPYVDCLGGARCRGTLVFLYAEPEE